MCDSSGFSHTLEVGLRCAAACGLTAQGRMVAPEVIAVDAQSARCIATSLQGSFSLQLRHAGARDRSACSRPPMPETIRSVFARRLRRSDAFDADETLRATQVPSRSRDWPRRDRKLDPEIAPATGSSASSSGSPSTSVRLAREWSSTASRGHGAAALEATDDRRSTSPAISSRLEACRMLVRRVIEERRHRCSWSATPPAWRAQIPRGRSG